MLEIPESSTIARQLNETVRGKKIAEVETEHTKHSFAWYQGEPSGYHEIMAGRTVGDSAGIGSMVEMELSEYSFVVGDGTNIRYYAPGEKLPVRYQMRITLEDDSSLVCTVQMYGTMLLIRPGIYDNPYYLAAKQKPLPLTEDFDYEYFSSLREGVPGKCSMKEFLATHQRIPGLGNGVLQDILFHAGMHPRQRINTLTETDWKKLYETVVEILGRMLEQGGRSTEKNLFGASGAYAAVLSKKTVGKPCPSCGNIIQKANYLGGTVYFCPECQGQASTR